jgi:hypothetical protein
MTLARAAAAIKLIKATHEGDASVELTFKIHQKPKVNRKTKTKKKSQKSSDTEFKYTNPLELDVTDSDGVVEHSDTELHQAPRSSHEQGRNALSVE